MRMSQLTELTSCTKVLQFYGDKLHECLRRGDQLSDPRAIVLQRGINFGRIVMTAMDLLAKEGQEYIPCVGALCRPYFELAARILWASRAQAGWERLATHWIGQDQRWANEAVRMPEFKELAQGVLARGQNADAAGKLCDPQPNMDQILREIDKHDVKQGISRACTGFGQWQYTNVYRILCRPAHAHITALTQSSPAMLTHARTAALNATWILLRAMIPVFAVNRKEAIEIVNEQMISIVKGLTDLRLDELRFDPPGGPTCDEA